MRRLNEQALSILVMTIKLDLPLDVPRLKHYLATKELNEESLESTGVVQVRTMSAPIQLQVAYSCLQLLTAAYSCLQLLTAAGCLQSPLPTDPADKEGRLAGKRCFPLGGVGPADCKSHGPATPTGRKRLRCALTVCNFSVRTLMDLLVFRWS